MIRQLTRPLLRPLLRPLVGKGGCERWVYNFDGVDDYGVFGQRLIDPDGDNSFGFFAPTGVSTQTIIAQNISESASLREFHLLAISGNRLTIVFGGVTTELAGLGDGYEPSKHHDLILSGNSFTLLKEGVQIKTGTFVRGGVREPAAKTTLMARTSRDIGTMSFHSTGPQYNIRINGHYYPINNPNSNIQRSVPDNGNPLELVNINQDRWSKIPC